VLFDHISSTSKLFVINADGTGRTQISDKVVGSTAAAFSPDGARVAFYAGTGKNELTVVNLSTGAEAVAARNAHPWSIENLDWSPDGRIAFVGAADTQRLGARNIYVVDADGRNPRALTSDAGGDNRWPVWSPDGTKLAYIHGKEIWTMNADGSDKRQITRESEWPFQVKMFPQWSPDQSMILFTAVAGNGVQGLLQVVDLQTLRVNTLATAAARGFWR
jgi:Tol biopolymer transport system component